MMNSPRLGLLTSSATPHLLMLEQLGQYTWHHSLANEASVTTPKTCYNSGKRGSLVLPH